MITIKANLHLYKNVRTTPFISGYRPTFDFGMGNLTSGRILLNKEKELFYPGETEEVEINFLFKEFLGSKFKVGEKIVFREGSHRVGEIIITEILEDEP